MIKLILFMTVLPALELVILIKVHGIFSDHYGGFSGLLFTVFTIVATGIIGATLARRQGLLVWREFQRTMQSGELPADELLDGVMILVGGALLLTPGFLTDSFGFALILPISRLFLRRFARRWLERHLATLTVTPMGSGGFTAFYHGGNIRPGSQPRPTGSRPVNHGDIIEGEIVDD